MLFIDNTVRKVPIAKVSVDTLYLSSEVEVQCLLDAIYDLVMVMYQVPGLQMTEIQAGRKACVVTTRNQAKKEGQHFSVKVGSASESAIVDKAKLIQMQSEDESLEKYWDRKDSSKRVHWTECPNIITYSKFFL